MAKQHGKKFRKSGSSGVHQLNWLWGKQSVLETLAAARWRVYELFVTAELMDKYADLLKSKQKEGVELTVVSADRLGELSQTADHEGIVARVSKYPYQTLESLESQIRMTSVQAGTSDETGPAIRQPLVVIIDRVQDIFNFAAILRSCESAGVCGVIVGEHCQSQVTTQVARSSLGAVNHFSIIQTGALVAASQTMKELGLVLVTPDSKSKQSVCNASLTGPIALLIGSDTLGLDPLLLGLCDQRVSIPTFGKSDPLHSAVAAGILLYEMRRQQR